MEQNKNLVFISHATPSDNYPATWLASKLKVLGYNVWIDLNDLSAGDSFNTVIKPIIKDQAKVFIAVTTKNYSSRSEDQNSGVSRELNCAATVDTSNLGHNFIWPVRFDDIEFNDFPYHYTGWNAISFTDNWQQGLIDIVKELEKAGVAKTDNIDNPINIWFDAIKSENKPIERNETYYSNWFGFELPEKIYVHKPANFIKQEIYDIPFPLTLEANRIITFATADSIRRFTPLLSSYEYSTKDFFSNENIQVEKDFTLIDARKKLIRLLNNAFQGHFKNQGLVRWVRGNKKVFYFKHSEANTQVSLKRHGKPRGRRALTGSTTEEIKKEKKTVNWAFSLRAEAEIVPEPHYRIIYALAFTDTNFKRFDKAIHHKLRRSVPSTWYNRKWMETLLAAMLKISPNTDSHFIEIAIGDNATMKVNNEPFMGISNVGYIEPDADAE